MKDFNKIIWRDALTFVDFFATWCDTCQGMHPIVDHFQELMKGRVDVFKIDIDSPDMQEVVRHYHITSVPTLIFFRHGEVLWRESGHVSVKELVKALETVEKKEVEEI